MALLLAVRFATPERLCCSAVEPSSCLFRPLHTLQVSKAASQQLWVAPGQLLLLAGAAAVLHLAFLAFNTAMVHLLRLGEATSSSSSSRKETVALQRAVVLVTSQKTLPVAVAVLSKVSVGASGAVLGLAVISVVVAHLGQILLDSLLVSHWQRQDRLTAGPA
jgi:solute carrier family 10 (sodium/bile acid cotransporter), member 7